MTADLSWLPALVLLSEHAGDWSRYVEAVYGLFKQDFIYTAPVWPGKRWATKRVPMHDGKEAIFWHIVSEGGDEASRTPDLRRCERVRWPRPIIDAAQQPRLKCWRNTRGGDKRVLIAVEDFSYVVVLADRGDYILLWTVYPVEREHQRSKLEREYAAFQATQKG
jgi:hypothetical protein